MMLLSDGKHPDILHIRISPEFPVHTFGLGARHNPEVMKYIADITSGTYSFINPDISEIKDALALFITGFTSIALKSITITLSAHNDIIISSIESGNYIHNVKHKSGTITIEHMYAGEQKDFIVNLRVGLGTKKLMTIGGYWEGFKGKGFFDEMDMSVTRPWLLPFWFSPDDLAIQPDVAAELTRIQLCNGVMHMLDRQELTDKGVDELWDMPKYSIRGRGALEEAFCGLNREMGDMYIGSSVKPYILSWLSCHKWQRATTKGTLSNSSSYRTIGQYYADKNTNLVSYVPIYSKTSNDLFNFNFI
jgi:hypothetical protein